MSKWLRILTVTDDRSLSMEQRAQLLTEVNGPVRLNVKLRRFPRPWQRATVDEALDAAGTAALDVLNGYLIAALMMANSSGRLRRSTSTRPRITPSIQSRRPGQSPVFSAVRRRAR